MCPGEISVLFCSSTTTKPGSGKVLWDWYTWSPDGEGTQPLSWLPAPLLVPGSILPLSTGFPLSSNLKAFATLGSQDSCSPHLSSLICSGLRSFSVKAGWALMGGELGRGPSFSFLYKKWSERKQRWDKVWCTLTFCWQIAYTPPLLTPVFREKPCLELIHSKTALADYPTMCVLSRYAKTCKNSHGNDQADLCCYIPGISLHGHRF